MSEEELTGQPVPESEETTQSETVEENPSEEINQEPEIKTFTQEELENILGKRLAKEKRKWERSQSSQVSNEASSFVNEGKTLEDFHSVDEYADYLAAQKAEQLIEEREQAKIAKNILNGHFEREEEARDKYDDYDQVVRNEKLHLSDEMAKTALESDISADILYHLGCNPSLAKKIYELSPRAQIKEIGKIEADLLKEPPSKKVSNAPPPINPMNGKSGSTVKVMNTLDPKSTKTMTAGEWIEAERERQRKLLTK